MGGSPLGLEEAGVVALLHDDEGDRRPVASLQESAGLLDRTNLTGSTKTTNNKGKKPQQKQTILSQGERAGEETGGGGGLTHMRKTNFYTSTFVPMSRKLRAVRVFIIIPNWSLHIPTEFGMKILVIT